RPAMAAAADLIRRLMAAPDPEAAEAFAELAEAEPEVEARAALAAELTGNPEGIPHPRSDGETDPVIDRWRREAALLLAEREERARRDGPIEVAVPPHLSVSQLVTLRRDPQGLARSLRRPLPQRPAPFAR